MSKKKSKKTPTAPVEDESKSDVLRDEVKKVVLEALDIREAIESLQRSIENEQTVSASLEEERGALIVKLQQMQLRAKESRENIKREKEKRRAVPDYDTSSGSEDEEEDDDIFDTNVQIDDRKPIDAEVEIMMAELHGYRPEEIADLHVENASTRDRQRALTVSRAATEMNFVGALRTMTSKTAEEVRRDDEQYNQQYDVHCRLLRDWITSERNIADTHAMFHDHTADDAVADPSALRADITAILAREKKFALLLNETIEKYMKPIIAIPAESRAFDISVIFGKFLSMVPVQTAFIDALSAISDAPDTITSIIAPAMEIVEVMSQYAENSQAMMAELRLASFGEVVSKHTKGNLQQLKKIMSLPSGHFVNYVKYMEKLEANMAEGSDDYVPVCLCLAHVRAQASKYCDGVPPITIDAARNRLALIELQSRIDWCGIKMTERELFPAKRKIVKWCSFVRKEFKAGKTISYIDNLYLYSDVLLVTRPSAHNNEEWMSRVYPLDQFLVWDIPDRAACVNKNVFEIVDLSKKVSNLAISAATEEQKYEWVDALQHAAMESNMSVEALIAGMR